MKKVLLDSNVVLLPVLQGIDVFECLKALMTDVYEVATLSSIVRELEGMQSSSSRRGVAARVSLELLRRNRVKVYETSLKPDASIIDFSLGNKDVIVCTNDGKLKKELRRNGIPVISPRGRKYMTFA